MNDSLYLGEIIRINEIMGVKTNPKLIVEIFVPQIISDVIVNSTKSEIEKMVKKGLENEVDNLLSYKSLSNFNNLDVAKLISKLDFNLLAKDLINKIPQLSYSLRVPEYTRFVNKILSNPNPKDAYIQRRNKIMNSRGMLSTITNTAGDDLIVKIDVELKKEFIEEFNAFFQMYHPLEWSRIQPKSEELITKIRQKKKVPGTTDIIEPIELKGVRKLRSRGIIWSKISAILDLAIKEKITFKNIDEGIDDVFGKLSKVVQDWESGGSDITKAESQYNAYFRDITTTLQSIKSDRNNFLDWEKTYIEIDNVLKSYGVLNRKVVIDALRKSNPFKTNHYQSPKNSELGRWWDNISAIRRMRETEKGIWNKVKGFMNSIHLELKWGTVKTNKEMAYYVDRYGIKGLGKLYVLLMIASKIGLPIVMAVFTTVAQLCINLFPNKFKDSVMKENNPLEIFFYKLMDQYKEMFDFGEGLGQHAWTTFKLIIPFHSMYLSWIGPVWSKLSDISQASWTIIEDVLNKITEYFKDKKIPNREQITDELKNRGNQVIDSVKNDLKVISNTMTKEALLLKYPCINDNIKNGDVLEGPDDKNEFHLKYKEHIEGSVDVDTIIIKGSEGFIKNGDTLLPICQ